MPGLAALIRPLPYALALAAFTVLRPPHPAISSDDSAVYLAMARTPSTWLAGMRPPTVPMLYAALGADSARIAFAQWFVGLACWLALAWAIARCVRAGWLRPIGFAAILGLAVAPSIAGWDRLVLSESLSLSLLALLVALGLQLLPAWSWWRVTAFVVVAALWIGCRDTNAYAVLLGAGLLGAGCAVRRAGWRWMVPIAVCVAIASGGMLSARAGERGAFPLHNVIGKRVLTDGARTDWYAERGMPLSPALAARGGAFADADLYADPALADYRAWVRDNGQATYVRDLATHPARSVGEAVTRLPALLSPDLALYVPTRPPVAPLGLLALAGATIAALALRRRLDARGIAPALLIATGLAGVGLAWHGDAMEVARHTLPSAVQVWLGCLLVVLLVADAALVHRHAPR